MKRLAAVILAVGLALGVVIAGAAGATTSKVYHMTITSVTPTQVYPTTSLTLKGNLYTPFDSVNWGAHTCWISAKQVPKGMSILTYIKRNPEQAGSPVVCQGGDSSSSDVHTLTNIRPDAWFQGEENPVTLKLVPWPVGVYYLWQETCIYGGATGGVATIIGLSNTEKVTIV